MMHVKNCCFVIRPIPFLIDFSFNLPSPTYLLKLHISETYRWLYYLVGVNRKCENKTFLSICHTL